MNIGIHRIGKILLFAAAHIVSVCFAQNQPKMGQQVPDFTISNLINYPSSTAKRSDFEGKLLLLEFWDSNCTSCMESWPKLINLQDELNDKIQIVLINTRQDVDLIRKLISKREELFGYKMTLPVSSKDSLLGQLFPHSAVPYVVWIDGEGVLKHTFYGSSKLTKASITSFLETGSRPGSSGVKFTKMVNPRKLLFTDGNGSDGSEMISQRTIAGHIEGLYPAWNLVVDSTFASCTMSNTSILSMLRFLYGGEINRFGAMTHVPKNRTALRGEDTTRFITFINGDPVLDNLFTYQLFLKRAISKPELKKKVLADIAQYFNVKFYWERQKRKCLVFTMPDSTRAMYESGPAKVLTDDIKFLMNGCTVEEMIQDMVAASRYYYSRYPILDETGYRGLIGGIKIETDVYDPKALDNKLKKHGLRFTLETREVDILVVEDL